MKKMSVMLVPAVIIISGFFADIALADRVDNRQIRQQKRIHQGVISGQLTRREAWALEREQVRINRHKQRACRDGRLSPGERIRLERERDRASRPIFKLRHNGIGW